MGPRGSVTSMQGCNEPEPVITAQGKREDPQDYFKLQHCISCIALKFGLCSRTGKWRSGPLSFVEV